MIIIISFLFLLSVVLNGILVWYTRKLIKNLSVGVDGVGQFQELLNEYCENLQNMLELDQYYGDETVSVAVKNTKMVIEACKFYKKSILNEEQEPQFEQQQTQ